eukprot:gnl/Dysnectes_brevis/7363_a12266_343.p1 GENE.gnl/Dysnectes_brevis/7363_a12266_343~~gnl/Dysnectes_brevis/7363_a12266_343.p1  ORF type:complete len:516 (-),score=23.46 gnl/Dysnectes_brevis/7363_a12266_343:11-1558(-)
MSSLLSQLGFKEGQTLGKKERASRALTAPIETQLRRTGAGLGLSGSIQIATSNAAKPRPSRTLQQKRKLTKHRKSKQSSSKQDPPSSKPSKHDSIDPKQPTKHSQLPIISHTMPCFNNCHTILPFISTQVQHTLSEDYQHSGPSKNAASLTPIQQHTEDLRAVELRMAQIQKLKAIASTAAHRVQQSQDNQREIALSFPIQLARHLKAQFSTMWAPFHLSRLVIGLMNQAIIVKMGTTVSNDSITTVCTAFHHLSELCGPNPDAETLTLLSTLHASTILPALTILLNDMPMPPTNESMHAIRAVAHTGGVSALESVEALLSPLLIDWCIGSPTPTLSELTTTLPRISALLATAHIPHLPQEVGAEAVTAMLDAATGVRVEMLVEGMKIVDLLDTTSGARLADGLELQLIALFKARMGDVGPLSPLPDECRHLLMHTAHLGPSRVAGILTPMLTHMCCQTASALIDNWREVPGWYRSLKVSLTPVLSIDSVNHLLGLLLVMISNRTSQLKSRIHGS